MYNRSSEYVYSFFTNIRKHTTDATSATETAYLSGTSEFTPDFKWGSCYLIFSFICNVL